MNALLRLGLAPLLLLPVARGVQPGSAAVPQDFGRRGVPLWQVDEDHAKDTFRFVRLEYSSRYRRYHRRGDWATDWPDSDLNFSFRLQQLTSLEVDPDPLTLRITDEELFDYPFVYMIEPGGLVFQAGETEALRRYCLNGGFLMVDDFWDDDEWANFERQIRRVFPDRDIVDVPLEHEIFHIVYDLKEKPQIPALNSARRGGVSWEYGYNTDTPNYRAIFDDQGRIMVFICHNTDLGDGWEREGEARWYFEEYSEKKAYPLGINIVVYALTH